MARSYTHLGEIFHVTEEHQDIVDAVLTKGASLSGGARVLFESADFEISGSSILERHEMLSPDGIPESLRTDSILRRFPTLTREQAKEYRDEMLKAGFTYPTAIHYVHSRVKVRGLEETLTWLAPIAEALQDCETDEDDLSVCVEQLEVDHLGMPTYGYHKVDSMFETQKPQDWSSKQPSRVQRLLTTPERCTSLAQLSKLGKGCYEAGTAADTSHLAEYQQVYRSLSNAQQSVFWGNYHSRKKALHPRTTSQVTQSLSARIKHAQDSDFRRLKGTLYKIQHGQLRLRDPPAKYEWSALWGQYRNRELQLGDTREIPEGHSRCGYCYISSGSMYLPSLSEPNPPKNNPATSQLHCLSCQYF